MTTIQSRRKLIVVILLCLAVGGALVRHYAERGTTTRDIGTLLMVLWVPIIGNVIAWLIGKLPRRAPPAEPATFDATRAFAGLEAYLRGHDVFALEAMRLAICNPTASLYNNRTQLHAALEFACLDIIGQKLGVPVHALLGGQVRDRIRVYSWIGGDRPAETARAAKDAVARGFSAV